MKSRFKVGDRVRIRKGREYIPPDMVGQTAVVTGGPNSNGSYDIEGNAFCGCFAYFDEMELDDQPVQLDLLTWEPPAPPAPKPALEAPKRISQLHPSDTIILRHLQRRKTISPMEALASYGCARLAPRIYNLRQAGYQIATKLNRDEPGHVYARYTLKDA